MPGSDSSNPNVRSQARSKDRKGDAARAERLRTALRENLKRRKTQARGRSQAGPGMEQAAARDSAVIMPDKAKD
jgi:hypothetical protein